MDFDWTPAQVALRRDLIEFARTTLGDPEPDGLADEAGFRRAWRLCGEKGVLGLALPEKFGGKGLDALTSARAIEALGYGCRDLGFVFSVAAHVHACAIPLARYASERLQAEVLPAMLSGERIAAHCLTEPGAGSDPFAIATRAERRGPGWVLSGAKCLASNAPIADVFLVQTVSDPSAGVLGLSAFVLSRGTPGLSVSPPHGTIGLRSAPLGDVLLEGCEVGEESLVGRPGLGHAIFGHAMNWERACLIAAYVGSMERQLEETVRHARGRRQFARPIGSFQGVSHRIADMKVRLEAARLLVYRAAWRLGKLDGEDPTLDCTIAKLFASEAAVQSSLDAIQVHGGLGILTEGGVERYLRDAVPSRIFSGTSEIQKNIVARALGLAFREDRPAAT